MPLLPDIHQAYQRFLEMTGQEPNEQSAEEFLENDVCRKCRKLFERK